MSAAQSRLKLGFYRQCRLWHGYLSAFAFGALLFFSITGIALNHAGWFADSEARSSTTQLVLALAKVQELRKARTPAPMLIKMVTAQVVLYGTYQDTDTDTEPDHIYVRMRGARGTSDIRANLQDGSIVVVSQRTTTIGLLNALHRGEQAGAAWRVFIDIAAGVLIAVAVAGYVIFFSMSARWVTALLITAIGLVGTVVLFLAFVR